MCPGAEPSGDSLVAEQGPGQAQLDAQGQRAPGEGQG